jgi:hypothetical protein
VLVTGAADLFIVPTQQNICQVPNAVSLTTAIDGGQRHARCLAAIPGSNRLETVVAMAAGLIEVIAKIAKQ